MKAKTLAYEHGYEDALTTLNEAQADEQERDPEAVLDESGWRFDWTEALVNACSRAQLRRLGLASKRALTDYQRGALAAVDFFFEKEVGA